MQAVDPVAGPNPAIPDLDIDLPEPRGQRGAVNVNDGLLSAAAGVAANTGPMFCPVKTYAALRTRRAWSGE